MTNHPTPAEAARLLREDEQRRQALRGAPYPAWTWFTNSALMLLFGVLQDLWGRQAWYGWIFVVPATITLAAQNRWLGLRTAPMSQGWGPGGTALTFLRLLGVLVLIGLVISTSFAQNALDRLRRRDRRAPAGGEAPLRHRSQPCLSQVSSTA